MKYLAVITGLLACVLVPFLAVWKLADSIAEDVLDRMSEEFN